MTLRIVICTNPLAAALRYAKDSGPVAILTREGDLIIVTHATGYQRAFQRENRFARLLAELDVQLD